MFSRLLSQLKRHEGLRLKPYRDTVGKLTIGYGRNLDDVGISKDEAEALLVNDVDRCRRALMDFPWFCALDDVRQDVVVNMAFNLGVLGVLGFKKMIAAIEQDDYQEAAREMLNSKWALQVGRRAEELAEQMATGEYPREQR